MYSPQGISVADAAMRLGVNERRVRALIAHGQLAAAQIGGRWIVDPRSVEQRRRTELASGRFFSPRIAWAVIAHLVERWEGVSLVVDTLSSAEWLRVRERTQSRSHLELSPRLRHRARLRHLRVHPASLPRLLNDPQLVRSGVSAAERYGFDVQAPGMVELYAPSSIEEGLRRSYQLREGDQPNVLLHLVDVRWPFVREERFAPEFVAALDLMESDDERSQRAGRELLARLEG